MNAARMNTRILLLILTSWIVAAHAQGEPTSTPISIVGTKYSIELVETYSGQKLSSQEETIGLDSNWKTATYSHSELGLELVVDTKTDLITRVRLFLFDTTEHKAFQGNTPFGLKAGATLSECQRILGRGRLISEKTASRKYFEYTTKNMILVFEHSNEAPTTPILAEIHIAKSL